VFPCSWNQTRTHPFAYIHIRCNVLIGTPLIYELDDDLKPIPQAGAIAPLQGRYLGDQDAIRARIEGVKNQTK
jgi:2,3-bisphosphoglycerate-dependent phosphoglycerate mutase